MPRDICNELGVRVGEIWHSPTEESDIQKFKIDAEEGLIMYNEGLGKWFRAGSNIYKQLIFGKINPMWRPKVDDTFWTVDFWREEGVDCFKWLDSRPEERLWKRGLVFKTKEEAEDASRKMLRRNR